VVQKEKVHELKAKRTLLSYGGAERKDSRAQSKKNVTFLRWCRKKMFQSSKQKERYFHTVVQKEKVPELNAKRTWSRKKRFHSSTHKERYFLTVVQKEKVKNIELRAERQLGHY
jgi:hypothetical protein